MFLLLLCRLASAGDNIDYIDLRKGQHAPFSGKLLKNDALAKIIATHNADLEKCNADANYNSQKLKLNLEYKYNVLDSKYTTDIKMYKSMIKIRDQQIKSYVKKERFNKWLAYGGFVLGSATSVAIFYSVAYH